MTGKAITRLVVGGLRDRHRGQPRCPACLRFGHGDHCGRYRCSACGARFVLDRSGRPRNIGEVVLAPLGVLMLITTCGIMFLFTDAGDPPIHPLAALLLIALAIWELYGALHEKLFRPHVAVNDPDVLTPHLDP